MKDFMNITKQTIVKKTRLAPRLIQFYVEEGVVVPISGGGTCGKSWQYSEKNMFEFGIIKQLVMYGMTVSRIRHIMAIIDKYIISANYFSTAGEKVKNFYDSQIIYLVVYDINEVGLIYLGQKISMAGYKTALILQPEF